MGVMHRCCVFCDFHNVLLHCPRCGSLTSSGLNTLACVQHPGMDFSGAQINGEVPDPAAFLGGFEKQK